MDTRRGRHETSPAVFPPGLVIKLRWRRDGAMKTECHHCFQEAAAARHRKIAHCRLRPPTHYTCAGQESGRAPAGCSKAAKKAAGLRAAKAAESASDDAAKELEGAVKEEGAEANAQLEALKKEQEEKLVKGCSFRHPVWPPLIHTRPW
jgi:hypothetical protein